MGLLWGGDSWKCRAVGGGVEWKDGIGGASRGVEGEWRGGRLRGGLDMVHGCGVV